MPYLGCFPIILFIFMLLLLPVLFSQIMVNALLKLRIEPGTAFLLVGGIFGGSLLNIPVKRITTEEKVLFHPFPLFGFRELWPHVQRLRNETVIAVNAGGCLIPAGIALYEIGHLLGRSPQTVTGLMVAVSLNVFICYKMAKPVEGIGIMMPAWIPPLAAVFSALALAPEEATPVAFVAGILGPLIGADLLHLKEISRSPTGLASIGGAGTFDGIVLSGILAAYLA